ncbi:MAG: AAA family ATPase [Limnochordia bacterium]
MKPIFLRFWGLHSYIDPQEIDFTGLLGAGVFGIFGPTGSGKSTILDAMTLALYGSVDRAARDTQGIINQECDQLFVAYTFELRDASAARRYRVERTFARGKNSESVATVQARLVELDRGRPGREDIVGVLADKARDVTTEVVRLLGLTLADFTRAVVLPQGKFAEFLSLKGKERRDMLERLFGLEIYGRRLTECVQAHLRKTKNELESVQAVLSEVEEASAEALAQAQARLKTAERAEAEALAKLKDVEKEYRQWERVWDWQVDLDQVSHQEEELLKSQTRIAASRQELDQAERAERVRAFLRGYAEACQHREQATESESAARKDKERAEQALKQAATARLEAQAAFTAESPRLFERQAELRSAVERQGRRVELAKALRSAEEEIRQLGEALRERIDVEDEAEAEAAEAAERLQGIRREIAERTVDPDERKRLGEAMAALRGFNNAQQQLERELRAFRDSEETLTQAEREAADADALVRDLKTQERDAQERLAEHRRNRPWEKEELEFRRRRFYVDARAAERVSLLLSELESREEEFEECQAILADRAKAERTVAASVEALFVALEKADEDLRRASAEQETAHRSNLAAALAVHLRSGEPCPVCGSRSHPQPTAAHEREALAALERRVAECQQAVETAQQALAEAQVELIQKRSEHKGALESHASAAAEVLDLRNRLTDARMPLPEVWRALNQTELKEAIIQTEQSLEEREAALQLWELELKSLEEDRQAVVEDLAEAQKALAAAEARCESARQAYESTESRLGEVQELCRASEVEWDQLRASASPGEVQEAVAQLERWDQELQTLQRQLTDCEEQLKTATQRIEQSRQERERLQREKAIAEERWQGLQQQDEQLAAEIIRVVGSTEAPEAVARRVAERLEQLTDTRDSTVQAEQQAQSAWHRAAQAHAGAVERLQGAVDREGKSEAALEEALAEAGFATSQEAEAALRSEVHRQQLRGEIERYRQDRLRLQNERERLEQQLQGRSLSQQEWEAWKKRRDDVEAAKDAALRERAIAADTLERLQVDHQRWQELNQQKASLSERLGRLEDLRHILRGNAFVDFLAEEQLDQVLQDASAHLGQLTRYRYALESGSDDGFVIRDDMNGGYRRVVNTLSGGETFLASLALALALSSQIQLRGRFPLEFFFLDEGFGSLDQETLDVVMTALERLQVGRLNVGVISHVQELRNRIQRCLIVEPPVAGERGSQVRQA